MDSKVVDTLKLVAKKNNLKIDFNNTEITLKDIKVDSLALLNLIFKVEEELNIRIDDKKLVQIKNLNDLIQVFTKAYNNK